MDSGDADTLYLQRRRLTSLDSNHVNFRANDEEKARGLLLGDLSVSTDVHFAELEAGTVVSATHKVQ